MRNLFYIAGVAVLSFGAGALVQHEAGQADAATWQLMLETNGQAYVMDYGLSLGDCYAGMVQQQGAGWSCEREG